MKAKCAKLLKNLYIFPIYFTMLPHWWPRVDSSHQVAVDYSHGHGGRGVKLCGCHRRRKHRGREPWLQDDEDDDAAADADGVAAKGSRT